MPLSLLARRLGFDPVEVVNTRCTVSIPPFRIRDLRVTAIDGIGIWVKPRPLAIVTITSTIFVIVGVDVHLTIGLRQTLDVDGLGVEDVIPTRNGGEARFINGSLLVILSSILGTAAPVLPEELYVPC
jgi:hypothetical protein